MSPKMSFCPGTSDVIMSIRLVDTFGLLNPLIEFCYGWGAREPLFPARLKGIKNFRTPWLFLWKKHKTSNEKNYN